MALWAGLLLPLPWMGFVKRPLSYHDKIMKHITNNFNQKLNENWHPGTPPIPTE